MPHLQVYESKQGKAKKKRREIRSMRILFPRAIDVLAQGRKQKPVDPKWEQPISCGGNRGRDGQALL